MNTLERLSAADQDNYKSYLNRMSQSAATSSKHLIPFYTIGAKTILDVGCADGTLIKAIQSVNPEARVIGIDLNQNAIDIATAAGLEVYHMPLEQVYNLGIEFDCVIFSSVLHEISSYADEYKFSTVPIHNALKCANHLLSDNGFIIIRDGLMSDWQGYCTMEFTNPEDEEWLKKFIAECMYPFFDYDCFKMGNRFVCDKDLAQEFLATWTWGENSWHREIKEKFCILTEKVWIEEVKDAGFDTIAFFKSKEDYPKYLTPKIKLYDNDNGEEYFPYMTCTIIANKVESF